MGTRILTLAPTADALAGGWAEDWANPWPKVESEPLETIDWDAQMRQHQRRVLVALLARGIMPERARELAQEAWLRVIEGHRSGRLRDLKLPGIVVAQASFLALDERRRSRRQADHDAAWDHDAGEGAEVIPLERQVLARDQLRRILDVVERAPQSAQRVFFLLYGKHVSSAAEVAAELGLSVQRVRQILCELRHKIRTELDEAGPRGGSK